MSEKPEAEAPQGEPEAAKVAAGKKTPETAAPKPPPPPPKKQAAPPAKEPETPAPAPASVKSAFDAFTDEMKRTLGYRD
jgi:hypothetical protein